MLDDAEPHVVMAAIDQLPEGCQDAEALVPRVERLAASLGPAGAAWHVPARAVVALARIAPDRARPLLETAATHSAWQVRATAADIARLLQDEAVALRLAGDEHANVRPAGLRALSRLASPALFDAAIAGLDAKDYDLIRTSAGFLDGAPDRPKAVAALLARLSTLTDEATDTSRDPRVAIVRRLGALMEPADAPRLLGFVNDLDPRVGEAAADAIAALSGGTAVAEVSPLGRYPRQPSAERVAEAPRAATLRLDDGVVVELELWPAVAPVAVAQFAERAGAGYYDGLTFHRIAANFVIQGGSPGANEYSGLPRYWRDEPGASNVRGTVGLSTRGRDSADGQIFVNLVDNYRLDHDYTVFARVTSGMDAIDRVLEGARIVSIVVQ
jgi:cyclophilin family peptidyl-prolyl cis-trans isomerase